FSTIFERTLKDIFAVQQNIAQQVGAALKLSLIHKNLDYSSALAKLDHLGVERLVIARARLNTYTDTSINQAFNDLNALNQRYPKTPEVLGLLAVAYNSLSHTAQQNVPNPKQQSAKTAKESLALDPTNLDALKALYYHYTDLAHLREQGYIISEQIIRHHPGRQSAWRTRLHLMINTMRPCQEIQTFVTSIPQGVFTAHRLSIINYILNVCLQSKPLEGLTALNTSGVNQATMNKAISNNLYFFEIRHDMMFDAVQIRSRRKPTQTILTDYYWLQLASGAHSNAKATAKLIDKQGFWPWLISLYNTLYGLPEVKMNQDDAVFSTKAAQLNIMHQFAATLIIQSKQTSDNTVVTEYLSNITPFPINLFNKNEAIALMMLQYHAGQLNQSQQTAKKLFDKLAVYYKNNRLSFEFWGLGGHYLIAKFHCGEQCEFNDSLDQLFKPDYALWMDDIGFMQVALGPWASEPVVMEYLNRIEQDRVRFREKFGL
ncbi:MAG: hypothetical protein HRT35_22120, partial [Algicola sp.]|nr:hypothetical protein [Algicola sp.]